MLTQAIVKRLFDYDQSTTELEAYNVALAFANKMHGPFVCP
jgi:hypothetical protein